jgi:hypothetical protein
MRRHWPFGGRTNQGSASGTAAGSVQGHANSARDREVEAVIVKGVKERPARHVVQDDVEEPPRRRASCEQTHDIGMAHGSDGAELFAECLHDVARRVLALTQYLDGHLAFLPPGSDHFAMDALVAQEAWEFSLPSISQLHGWKRSRRRPRARSSTGSKSNSTSAVLASQRVQLPSKGVLPWGLGSRWLRGAWAGCGTTTALPNRGSHLGAPWSS